MRVRNAPDWFPIFYTRRQKPYLGRSGEHLLVINSVEYFLVKLLPRDAVPSGCAVRRLPKLVEEDIHVPAIFQIQVAQTFGIFSRGQESK